MTFKLVVLSCAPWEGVIILDFITIGILLMLLICFSYAINYTHHYFGGGSEGSKLNFIICLFVFIMASLVTTGDILSTLVFWEYLGVVRFFLILFYLNYLSLRASVITLVSSRFGDVCLFIFFALSLCTHNLNWLILTIFFFVVCTKRAAFPFTSWLLEAMRAPTPVSSLVHSSTLVAAGVWFRFRYDGLSYFQDYFVIIVILLITVTITGVCCFFFTDLKKIVALSTCNNISWCILYLIVGDVGLALFQLMRHGVSKCLLFMLVGDIMRGASGSQAAKGVYCRTYYGNIKIFSLFCVVLGLSGAPFIGVFFTKHLFIGGVARLCNPLFVIGCLCCVFLSYFYSFRLCVILCGGNKSINLGVTF